jgi:DNA-directed RNA polymerase specialized sigma24 family protein
MERNQIGLSKQDNGYELFRRAIVEGDDDAWAAIHARYRALLITWAQQCSAMPQIGEYCDDIADQALARAWSALSPARFNHFPNLAGLLAYLRTCVAAVVIDCARAQAAHTRALQQLEVRAFVTPEQVFLRELEREELWRLVSGLAETQQERIVLIESFMYDLPPRTILTRHPELFMDVSSVYYAKRNLRARLQRNCELQQMRQDLLSAQRGQAGTGTTAGPERAGTNDLVM